MTGYFTGAALFDTTSLTNRGLADAFVMHVTAAGAIDWAIQAGGTSFTALVQPSIRVSTRARRRMCSGPSTMIVLTSQNRLIHPVFSGLAAVRILSRKFNVSYRGDSKTARERAASTTMTTECASPPHRSVGVGNAGNDVAALSAVTERIA